MLRATVLAAGCGAAAAARCPFTGQEAPAGGSCPGFGPAAERLRQAAQEPAELMAVTASASAGQGTFGGCKCKSQCGADVSDGFNCDWCYTEGSCGHGGLGGHFDYCVYPGNQTFDTMDWKSKTAQFWRQLSADKNGLTEYPDVAKIVAEGVQTTFDNHAEVMPAGRVKMIHSIGAVCQIDFNVTSASKYTGLLAPGSQTGFIRMGSAVDPVANKGLTPGLGFKFARTGVHSGQFVALHSLDFGQTWNFFGVNQSNHIPGPSANLEQQVLVKKFDQASQCPPQVGLSDLAKYAQDGTPVSAPHFPFKLFFVPRVQTPDTPKTIAKVSEEMEAFKVGTALYTVYACDMPKGDESNPTGTVEDNCGSPLKLGDMVTTSPCTTSKYGDESFQIVHQRVEEDWALRPEFLTDSTYDAAKVCGWKGPVSAAGVPKKCHKA